MVMALRPLCSRRVSSLLITSRSSHELTLCAQLRMHQPRDTGDPLAVAGDVGEADAGDDPRVAHRAVVDVAALGAVTRARVEDTGQAGQINDRPAGFVASANFTAN